MPGNKFFHAAPGEAYNRIADIYDLDMGRNMAFDDVGFYRALCRRWQGKVLEIGCGNGRILLDLSAAGISVTGIDVSERMLLGLRHKAKQRGLVAEICLADGRALPFDAQFDVVLCPYSVMAYFGDEGGQFLEEVARVMRPRAKLVIDVFVPHGGASYSADFTTDYRRENSATTLERAKRITALTRTLNRVERRYRLSGPGPASKLEINTTSVIRPYSPEELVAMLMRQRFVVERTWWDYQASPAPDRAQFFTVAATRQ